ncbi:MAG: PA2169 family four-helix-bundle protein [Ferruginibacter sp.]|nr:PA2169 family four-helix-bundle protein [Cytophagales bacterium]
MAITNQEVVDILQELTEFVNDGKEGYEKAAKETKDAQNEAYYRSISLQRTNFAQELNQLIRTYGGEAETDTTLKGKVYRQWMDLKATFTGRDEGAILDSNIYGEEWAQKAYNDALENTNLPPDVRQVVEAQRKTSQEVYAQLNQMKGSSQGKTV